MHRPLLLIILCCCGLYAMALYPVRVLWLGTSIPAGCTYPAYACAQLGALCENQARGASFLTSRELVAPFEYSHGLSLTMTADEKEMICRTYVETGEIKASDLKDWKNASYDVRLLPYVRQSDVVIIDHGYNDRDIIIEELKTPEEQWDWESRDRSTFLGAFGYLYDIIRSENPDCLVVVGGYFQRHCTKGHPAAGEAIATMWERIAAHYDLPLLNIWDYSGINTEPIAGSANYFAELNDRYGTDFLPVSPDDDGNISAFSKFCPDGVHPFTDPTGESDRLLNIWALDRLRYIFETYAIPIGAPLPIARFTWGGSALYNLHGKSISAPQLRPDVLITGDGRKVYIGK